MTLSKSPQYRAFSSAVMDEKSLSPLFPVGVCVWGAGGGQWLQMIGALIKYKADKAETTYQIRQKRPRTERLRPKQPRPKRLRAEMAQG